MFRNSIIVIRFLVIAYLLSVAGPTAALESDLQVLSSSSRSLLFQWTPEYIREAAAGQKALIRHGVGDSVSGQSVRQVWVALPDEVLPVIEVVETSEVAARGTDVETPQTSWLGTPVMKRVEERTLLALPIHTLIADGTGAKRLTSIKVRITFNGDYRGEGQSRGPRSFINRFVLNPDLAGHWVTHPLPQPVLTRMEISGDNLYRFTVTDPGLYQLDYTLLSNLQDPGSIQLRNLHVYCTDGRALPESVTEIRDSALFDLPLIFEDDGDNVLEPGERVLMYIPGPRGWTSSSQGVDHFVNLYSDQLNGYIKLNGLEPSPLMSQLSEADQADVSSGEVLAFLDEFKYVVNENPYYVYGDRFYDGTLQEYSHNLPDRLPAADAQVNLEFYCESNASADLTLSWDNTVFGNTDVSSSTNRLIRTVPFSDLLTPGPHQLGIHSSGSGCYLDYYEIRYGATLRFYDREVWYATEETSGDVSYQFVPQADKWILDVTDPVQPQFTTADLFSVALDNRSHLLLGVRSDGVRTPADIVPVQLTDLAAVTEPAEYLVIVADQYYDLMSSYIQHRNEQGTDTRLINLEWIYDSYSGGNIDPVAIRDFLYREYLRYPDQLKAVLLVGNGHYDYRSLTGTSDPVTMPFFYKDATWVGGTYPLDDFYVRFESGGTGADTDYINLAVSRWQCYQSADVLAHIEKYLTLETATGDQNWRNRMILVADDEYYEGYVRSSETRHTRNSENLINTRIPREMDVRRLYSTLYPLQFSSVNGIYMRPECHNQIISALNEGAWFVNFMGHGNNQVWTHERIFTSADLDLIDNYGRWPVFLAATCSWADLDLASGRAYPVMLMNEPGNGAAGVIAASNLTNGTDNLEFTGHFFDEMFSHYAAGTFSSPATCLQTAKNLDLNEGNRKMYLSLGDPMHPWDYPDYSVGFGEFVNDATGLPTDSLRSMNTYRIGVSANERSDSTLVPHSGTAWMEVRDAPQRQVIRFDYTTWPDSLVYYPDGNLLFRGRFTLDEGHGIGHFTVPRDLLFSDSSGLVRVFYENEARQRGTGYRENFYLLAADSSITDEQGPEIDLRFNSENWEPGDLVSPVFTAILLIGDDQGINLTGEIGHKITLRFDDETAIDVTDYFLYDVDSHTRGRLSYPVSDLAAGEHRVTAQAWDIMNNLSQYETDIVVSGVSEQRLVEALNYPNPFADETVFTCRLDGVRPGLLLEPKISIYTLSGRRVNRLEFATTSDDPVLVSQPWNGRDSGGNLLANGVYFYRVEISLPADSYTVLNADGIFETVNQSAKKVSAESKLVIGR